MELREFFKEHPKIALGFSGGVDSSFLLYAAKKYGAEVGAYFIKSQFQPEFELTDAERLAEQLGVDLQIVRCDILTEETVKANPKDRCYYCKKRIFGLLAESAKKDGYEELIDGTNASDEAGDRPGMRALAEMKVLSPLRLCGITKAEVRALSKEAGLFTWDKPAYACLATRIPTGELITEEKLAKVQGAESQLSALGYTDSRIRIFDGAARLQLKSEQMEMAVSQREMIRERLKPYFAIVLLDLEDR